jgi:hypothetical protein
MATTRTIEQGIVPASWIATWTSLLNGETGDFADIPLDAATRSIQVSGTFGAAGNVIIEGSNDGATFFTLNNAFGTALGTVTAAAINSIDQNCRFVRPRVSAGDGTTNLKVVLVAV